MSKESNPDPEQPDPDELSERAATLRVRLDALVSELDRRRHVVARTRRVLTENPVLAVGAAVALGLVAAFGIMALQRRRRRSFAVRKRRLLQAING
jgi:hypothetical protein